MEQLQAVLDKVEKMFSAGEKWEIIEEKYAEIKSAFPNDIETIFFHQIDLLYKNQAYKEAVFKLTIEYTQNGKNPNVYNKLIELFWEPVKEERMQRYNANASMLQNYELAYGELKEYPEYLVLWSDDTMIIYTDGYGNLSGIDFGKLDEISAFRNSVLAVTNELWEVNIDRLEVISRMEDPHFDEENPLCLLYDDEEWDLMMQLFDLKRWISLDRIVFIRMENGLSMYLSDLQNRIPNIFIGGENYRRVCDFIIQIREQNYMTNMQQLKEYYSSNQSSIIEHIKSGKPSIVFFTTRFSTALQYHIRDCNISAQKQGCRTAVMIESHRTRVCSSNYMVKILIENKPDIMFQLDHFRYEIVNFYPKEMIFVTWAQDVMPHIMDCDTPSKLGDRDFVVSQMAEWESFKKVGYSLERLIFEPIPANAGLYHPVKISKEDKAKYGADVCMICHSGNVMAVIQEEISCFPEASREMLLDAYVSYVNYAKETENVFLDGDVIKGFFDVFIKKFYSAQILQSVLLRMENFLLTRLNPVLYRQMLADWLIAEKDINVKLWGRGWTEVEAYKQYAMGIAPNGEEMSKIIQSSKIVLGNNIALTGAARAAETMLCGAFYLSIASVPKHDLCNIFQWFKENEELESFHNREELIEKVRYYLQNDEARIRKAETGRKKALQKLTYDVFMKDVIQEIGKRM